jgi:hypothetical protein
LKAEVTRFFGDKGALMVLVGDLANFGSDGFNGDLAAF